jgi:hypothetical protein
MSRIKVEVITKKAPRALERTPKSTKRQKALEARRTATDRIFAVLHWLSRRSVAAWLCAAALGVTVTLGTPHVLVTYSCINGGRCFECRYFGIQGMRDQLGPQWNCPVFVMMPVDWAPLIRKLKNG